MADENIEVGEDAILVDEQSPAPVVETVEETESKAEEVGEETVLIEEQPTEEDLPPTSDEEGEEAVLIEESSIDGRERLMEATTTEEEAVAEVETEAPEDEVELPLAVSPRENIAIISYHISN